MAIGKLRDDKSNNKYDDVIDDSSDEPFVILIKSIFEKIDESVIKTNDHITDVANMKSDIGTNNSKVGISTAQANAITANTAKVGITTKQTQQLALAVSSLIPLTSAIKNTTASLPAFQLVPGRNLGSYSLRFSIRVAVSGGKTTTQYIDLPLTAGK